MTADGRPAGIPRVVVVGGGIAGLAAALRLRERFGDRVDLSIVDQADRLGGKLRTGELAGATVEAGAESFLVRDPDGSPSAAVRLAERVGLAAALRHPAPVPAALAIGGRLLPIPRRTLMGVPADPGGLGDVASPAAGGDPDEGRPLLEPDEDVSVGDLVGQRLGGQVVERLVDPLLGGVYAGRAVDLSLAATVPALAAACRTSSTLTGAVHTALELGRPTRASGPVFATVEGGMSRLVDAVARESGARLLLGDPVRQLRRTHNGWRMTLGSTRDPRTLEADAVVLAVPAAPAARLLARVSPAAAAEVAELDYASVALVGMALPATDLPPLSGFLVPATEGYAVKALTIVTTKWPHLRTRGLTLLRASVGRYRDTEALRRTDEDLIALVRKELGLLLRTELPEPVAARVNRWGGALPQYAPGHLARVAGARAALAGENVTLAGESLALAGAAYDGVGIPACVRSGFAAADQVADALRG